MKYVAKYKIDARICKDVIIFDPFPYYHSREFYAKNNKQAIAIANGSKMVNDVAKPFVQPRVHLEGLEKIINEGKNKKVIKIY